MSGNCPFQKLDRQLLAAELNYVSGRNSSEPGLERALIWYAEYVRNFAGGGAAGQGTVAAHVAARIGGRRLGHKRVPVNRLAIAAVMVGLLLGTLGLGHADTVTFLQRTSGGGGWYTWQYRYNRTDSTGRQLPDLRCRGPCQQRLGPLRDRY